MKPPLEKTSCRVRNLKFATFKTLVNFMKKKMFLSKNWYFSVQKALIYYTVNKSHHNSFILLVFSHVANCRYVANFRFLTLIKEGHFFFGKATLNFSFAKLPLTLLTKGLPRNLRREQMSFKFIKHSLKDTSLN